MTTPTATPFLETAHDAASRGAAEAARRRTFAIISHPDAGKTTLTEKILLHAGALREAGSVTARRRARATVSDWMEIERRRGISISSTVLRLESDGWLFNLVDAPGHADFSEDTYRTLWAVDAALMVVDGTRGLERQTLKLFEVCRRRGLPIVTFINKCDRPGIEPLALLDEIEERIGLRPIPVTWPAGTDGQLDAVVDRLRREVLEVGATAHGATIGAETVTPLDAWQAPPGREHARDAAVEELELLDASLSALDANATLDGTQTPVFFGSALTNHGLRSLLRGLPDFMPSPRPAARTDGHSQPVAGPFSAQVFKIQANLDPRHRDRIAFMRVQSGLFVRGMSVIDTRSGRRVSLKHAHEIFGQERETIAEAGPGDIVGIVNASGVLIGDTLAEEPDVRFPPIPAFLPEQFAYVHNREAQRYKRFGVALRQLDEEGVIRVLEPVIEGGQRIIAAVGSLQFEVMSDRMASEFGCPVTVTAAPYDVARWLDPAALALLPERRGVLATRDASGELLALFGSRYALETVEKDLPAGALATEPRGMDFSIAE